MQTLISNAYSLSWLASMLIALSLHTQQSEAFGVDICFNDTTADPNPIRNCIGVGEACRKQPLEPAKAVRCRVKATADSLSGLTGTNAIIGGRSLMHSDSAYAMAQLLGYSPWQAYQILIYAEATDQSSYEAFDQQGLPMMSPESMEACYQQDMRSEQACLAITPLVLGLYKFNDTNGGQLLHEHPRYAVSPDIADTQFPTNYMSPENAPKEVLINNLRAWAFGERDDLCVAGITQDIGNPRSACVSEGHLDFPMYFFAFAYANAVPFRAELGVMMINDDPLVMASTSSAGMADFLPHDPDMAKLGIYLHSLADRVSHHMCTDRSTMYPTGDGNFNTDFSTKGCAQGSHFLWHVWEQGTDQNAVEGEDYRTMPVALDLLWEELKTRGEMLGVVTEDSISQPKDTAIDQIVELLGIFDPADRLNAMVDFMETNGITPLPGHGRYQGMTLEDWLVDVGAQYQ